MNLKKNRPVFELLVISFLLYGIHKSIFFFNHNNPKFVRFYYSLEFIYGFFCFCSVLIITLLMKIKSKNINNVGYTFLLVTSIKMGLSYLVLLPLLDVVRQNNQIEKINFFMVFALFLAIETVVTIRILNNKQ